MLDHSSAIPAGVLPIAEVVAPTNGVGFTGGNVTVDRTIDDVRKNDWVMLINQDPGLEPGFQIQVGFYRVVDTFVDTMTINGPDFNFGPDSTPAMNAMTTYAVHLVNYNGPDFLGTPTKLNRQGRVIQRF